MAKSFSERLDNEITKQFNKTSISKTTMASTYKSAYTVGFIDGMNCYLKEELKSPLRRIWEKLTGINNEQNNTTDNRAKN